MLRLLFKRLITTIGFVAFAFTAKAQSGFCPSNLDFELGNFSGWICEAGIVDAAGNIMISPSLPIPDRHTIISASTAGVDPYGGFPELCPNGSGFSVRLGNSSGGHQAEGISYTYTIPSTLTVFSMLFNYAVVLQDPFHLDFEQPRFRARITDLTTGLPIPCVDFDFIASGSLPGFTPSPLGGGVIYKGWTPITINLNAFIGRTIKLEFITNDCVYTQHFGYAYIDVNTNCNGAISGAAICEGDNAITLTAPFGFQSYQWYSDITFTNLLATTQSLPLNPAPTVGTVIPVVVEPYPGYGCKDTLYATISVTPKPVSEAGPDASVCKWTPALIGGPPTMGYQYEWTPANMVFNPVASSTAAWNAPPVPQKFYLKTTDLLTGCFSIDSVIVSNTVVDTVMGLAGSLSFCDYGPPGVTLSVNNSSSPIQWYDGANPIAGANSPTFQPLQTGNYWAQITQQGCTDTTSIYAVKVNPLPDALFIPFNETICITNPTLQFTNQSTTPDNSNMTYNWKFSDGTTQQVTDANKIYTGVGSFGVELVTTTEYGCKDSISSVVNVVPNANPDFKWDSLCNNRPSYFTNLTNENSSASVNYTWTFNDDASTVSLVKNPPPISYTKAGPVDVTLEAVSVGCEAEPQTITKTIYVNPVTPGIRYKDLTVPQGASQFVHVRGDVGTIYNWKPHIQLNNYSSQYVEYFATGNDVLYHIDITDKHTCVTTDTMLIQVLKKPGYYLPTAFTPNGDGLNDRVRPYLVGQKSLKSFSVFNRWGNLIFQTKTEGQEWDGKSKGVDQDNGVYVWILEFYNNDGKLITEKGTITIIR